ncbi:MAG TPA: hypothetical protein VMU75_01175 [Acidimicrobiales bacterium]|nr:hypothetical protein [Acidimicrobiales bacterium]
MSDRDGEPREHRSTRSSPVADQAASVWTRVGSFLKACVARLVAVDPTSPREPTFLLRPVKPEEEGKEG